MQGCALSRQACQTALTVAHVHARAETVGRGHVGAERGLRGKARAQRYRAALPGAQRSGRRDRAWRALLASGPSQDAASKLVHGVINSLMVLPLSACCLTACTSLQAASC